MCKSCYSSTRGSSSSACRLLQPVVNSCIHISSTTVYHQSRRYSKRRLRHCLHQYGYSLSSLATKLALHYKGIGYRKRTGKCHSVIGKGRRWRISVVQEAQRICRTYRFPLIARISWCLCTVLESYTIGSTSRKATYQTIYLGRSSYFSCYIATEAHVILILKY